MANRDMDQPETQQEDRDRDVTETPDEGKVGGGVEEIRGIAAEEEEDEEFENTEDLEGEDTEEGGV